MMELIVTPHFVEPRTNCCVEVIPEQHPPKKVNDRKNFFGGCCFYEQSQRLNKTLRLQI